jgi:glycosyltransferase involved in cell wall biosynthesis
MKIAFIGQKGIPAKSGGVEKHVENLSRELAALGHEVFVYTRPHYTDKAIRKWCGVTLVTLPSIRTKHLDAITHTFLATLHALGQEYDVIHYQSIGPSLLAFIPRLLKRKALVIATFHSRDYFHKKWNAFARQILLFGERVTCTIPEKTIAISRGMTEYARERYGSVPVFIPNGAEGEPVETAVALRKFNLKEKRYILSVSRLVAHKGIHYLVKAFQDLEDTGRLPNNFKLVIVGAHAETPEYEAYLKMLSLGRGNILFLGERTGQELAELFSHAAVFVQPSEDEGLSIALLEAMSYGLPIVASDIAGNREALDGAGAYFRTKDVESLKQELAYMLNRPDEMALYGKLARGRAKSAFSWEAIAKQTLDVYHDAMREHISKRSYAIHERKNA